MSWRGDAIAIAAIATLVVVTAPACGRSSPESASPANSPSTPGQAAPAPAGIATAPVATTTSASTPAGITLPAAPADAPQAKAIGPMAVVTQAIELHIEGVSTAAQIGSRQARPGYEFVIVDTSWKNIIPLKAMDKKARNPQGVGGLGGFGNNRRPSSDPADLTMEPTLYVVPMLKRQMWLLSDERYADTVDTDATAAVPDHLPANGFSLAKFEETLRGTVAFEVPANATYRAFQFYDNDNGHVLITLSGSKPVAAPTVGQARQNDLVQLAVSEAGFGPAGRQPPAGRRYYTVGLRGVSRSARNIIDLPLSQAVFLQDDRGCVSQPERGVTELPRPFGDAASFIPTGPNEGQMAFLVPDDTKNVRLLITPTNAMGIVLPMAAEFTPSWPAPAHSIQDGSTMKVHILPTPARPAMRPAPAAGREQVLIDVVIENMKGNQGIEFQGTQQLRLVDPSGAFIQPSPLSVKLPCRLDDAGVIPGGAARRFMLVYDVPAGMARRLQYRGFEKDEVFVDLK